MTEGRGETPDAGHEGTEALLAKRDTQSPATGESHRRPLNSIEPPWYGPVCPVVWEGRSREAPPYPHQFPLSPLGAAPTCSSSSPGPLGSPGSTASTATQPSSPPGNLPD